MKNSMRDTIFRAMVARQCVMLGLKKYQLADKAGMPHSTFYMKLAKPERFTVQEMRDICNILKFSVEEKSSIL